MTPIKKYPKTKLTAKVLKDLEYFLKNLSPIKPIPTGTSPAISLNKNIKAVIFDIYGTLLVSSTGDIDGFDFNCPNLEFALADCGIKFPASSTEEKNEVIKLFISTYKATIQNTLAEARSKGFLYPEIDIITIWEEILQHAINKSWIDKKRKINSRKLAFVFEILSNHVSPMPGLPEILNNLHDAGLPLGVISNAQFYTPMLMNYFLENKLKQEENMKFFRKDLCIFSFKNLRAKPDSFLFEKSANILKVRYDIVPEQVLYIGNDMYKDIYPAHQTGFRTVLFAGDKRSLKWHKDKRETTKLKPDHIITELEQINEILGL